MGSHYDASEAVSTVTSVSPSRRGFVMAETPSEVVEVYRGACAAADVRPISSFMKLLKANQLSDVVLDHSYFGERGLAPVLSSLRCTKMACLSLRSCMLSYEHVKPLRAELAGHPYLTALDLSGNQFGLPSAKALLELIEQTPTLTRVAVDPATPRAEYIKQRCLANMNVHIPINTCVACRRSIFGEPIDRVEMVALHQLSKVLARETPPSPAAMPHLWGVVRDALQLNGGLLTLCDVDCLHDWVSDVLARAEVAATTTTTTTTNASGTLALEYNEGSGTTSGCSHCGTPCGPDATATPLAAPCEFLIRSLEGELGKLAAPVSASALARLVDLLAGVCARGFVVCSRRCGRAVLRRGLCGGGGVLPLPVDSRDLLVHDHFGTSPTVDTAYTIADAVRVVDQGEFPLSAAIAVVKSCEHGDGDQLDPFFTHAAGGRAPGGLDLRTACRSVVRSGVLPTALAPYAAARRGAGGGGSAPATDGLGRGDMTSWLSWRSWSDLTTLHKAAASRRKGAYYLVTPNAKAKDLFDAIRSVSWSLFPAKRPVITACKWRPAWAGVANGVIPYTRYKGGLAHAVRIVGQKVINETVYLVAAPSLGQDVGDRGLFYFPREVVNREFKFGTYVFRDRKVPASAKQQQGPLSAATQVIVDSRPHVESVLALLSTPSMRQEATYRAAFAPFLETMPREASFLFRSCSRHPTQHEEDKLTSVRRLYASGCLSQIAFFWECQTPTAVRDWLQDLVETHKHTQRDVRRLASMNKRRLSQQTFLVRRKSTVVARAIAARGEKVQEGKDKPPRFLKPTSSSEGTGMTNIHQHSTAAVAQQRSMQKASERVKSSEGNFVRGLMAAKGLSRFQNIVTSAFSGGVSLGGAPESIQNSVLGGASAAFLQLLANPRSASKSTGASDPNLTGGVSLEPSEEDLALSTTAYCVWAVQVAAVSLDPSRPEPTRIHVLHDHLAFKNAPMPHAFNAVCYAAPYASHVAYLFSGGVWCEYDLSTARATSGPRAIAIDVQFRELPVAFHTGVTCCITLPEAGGRGSAGGAKDEPAARGRLCYFIKGHTAVLWDLHAKTVVSTHTTRPPSSPPPPPAATAAADADGPFAHLPACFAERGIEGCVYKDASNVYLTSGCWGVLWDLDRMAPDRTAGAPFLLYGRGAFTNALPAHFTCNYGVLAKRLTYALLNRSFERAELFGYGERNPRSPVIRQATVPEVASTDETFAALARLHCNVDVCPACTIACCDPADACVLPETRKTLLRTLVQPKINFHPYTAPCVNGTVDRGAGVVRFSVQPAASAGGGAPTTSAPTPTAVPPRIPRPPSTASLTEDAGGAAGGAERGGSAGAARGRQRRASAKPAASTVATHHERAVLTFDFADPQRFQYVQVVGDVRDACFTVSASADGLAWRPLATATTNVVVSEVAWAEYLPCKLWRVEFTPRSDVGAGAAAAGVVHRVLWYTTCERAELQALKCFEVASLPVQELSVTAPRIRHPECLCPPSSVAPQAADIAWDTKASQIGWYGKQAVLPLLNASGQPSNISLFFAGTSFVMWSSSAEGPPTAAAPFSLTTHERFACLPGPLRYVGIDAAVYVSPRTNPALVYLFCDEFVVMWDLERGAAVGPVTPITQHEAFKGLPPAFHGGCDTAANMFRNTADDVAFFKDDQVVYWDMAAQQVLMGPSKRGYKVAGDAHPFGNLPASFGGPSLVVAKLPKASEGFAVFAKARWLHYRVEGRVGDVSTGPHDVSAHRRYIKLPGALSWHSMDKVGYVLLDLKACPEMFIGVQAVAGKACSVVTFKVQWSDDNQHFSTAGILKLTDTGRVTWTTSTVGNRSHRFWRLLLWPYAKASLTKVEWLRLPLRTAYVLPSAVRTSSIDRNGEPQLRSGDEVESLFGHLRARRDAAHTATPPNPVTFHTEEELIFEFPTPFIGAIQLTTDAGFSSWAVSCGQGGNKWTQVGTVNVVDGFGQSSWDPFEGGAYWRLELVKGAKTALSKITVLVYAGPVATHGSELREDVTSQGGLLLLDGSAEAVGVELQPQEAVQYLFRHEPIAFSKVVIEARDRALRGDLHVQCSGDGRSWENIATTSLTGLLCEMSWRPPRPARHWRVKSDNHNNLARLQWLHPPSSMAARGTQLAKLVESLDTVVSTTGEIVSRARPLAKLLSSNNLDPVVTLHPGQAVTVRFPEGKQVELAGLCLVTTQWEECAPIPEEIASASMAPSVVSEGSVAPLERQASAPPLAGGGSMKQRSASQQSGRRGHSSRRQSARHSMSAAAPPPPPADDPIPKSGAPVAPPVPLSRAGSSMTARSDATAPPAQTPSVSVNPAYPTIPGLSRFRVELSTDVNDVATVVAPCHAHTGRTSQTHWGVVGRCRVVKLTALPGEPVTLVNMVLNACGSVSYVRVLPEGVAAAVVAAAAPSRQATPDASRAGTPVGDGDAGAVPADAGAPSQKKKKDTQSTLGATKPNAIDPVRLARLREVFQMGDRMRVAAGPGTGGGDAENALAPGKDGGIAAATATAASTGAYLELGEILELTFAAPQKLRVISFKGRGGALALSMWDATRDQFVEVGKASPAVSMKGLGASTRWRVTACKAPASTATTDAPNAHSRPADSQAAKAAATLANRVYIHDVALLVAVETRGVTEVEPAPYVDSFHGSPRGGVRVPSTAPLTGSTRGRGEVDADVDEGSVNGASVDAQFTAAKDVTKRIGKYIKERKTTIRTTGLDFDNLAATTANGPLGALLKLESLSKLITTPSHQLLAVKEWKLAKALPNPDPANPVLPRLEYIGGIGAVNGGTYRSLYGSTAVHVLWLLDPQAPPIVYAVFDVGEEWTPIGTFPECPALLYLLPPVRERTVVAVTTQALVFCDDSPLVAPATGAVFTSERGIPLAAGVSVVAELTKPMDTRIDPFDAMSPRSAAKAVRAAPPARKPGVDADPATAAAAADRPPTLRLLDLLMPDEPIIGIFSAPSFLASRMALNIQLGTLRFDSIGAVAESMDVELCGGKCLTYMRIASVIAWSGLRFRMTGEVLPEDDGCLRLTGPLIDGAWEDLHEIDGAHLLDPVLDIHFSPPSECPAALGVASATVSGTLVFDSGVTARCSVDVASAETMMTAYAVHVPIYKLPQFALLPAPPTLDATSWLVDHVIVEDVMLRINAASDEVATHCRKHSVTGSIKIFSNEGTCTLQRGSLEAGSTDLSMRAVFPSIHLGMLSLKACPWTSGAVAEVQLDHGGVMKLTGSTIILGIAVDQVTIHMDGRASWFDVALNFGGNAALSAALRVTAVGAPPHFRDFLVTGEFDAELVESVLLGLALEVPILQAIVAAGLLPTLRVDGVHLLPFHLSAPAVCVRVVGIILGSDFDVFGMLDVDNAQDFFPSVANQIMEQCWDSLLALYNEYRSDHDAAQPLLDNAPVIEFGGETNEVTQFDDNVDW